MKKYMEPVISITKFSTENIVTNSVASPGGLLEDIADGQSGMVTSALSYESIFATTE